LKEERRLRVFEKKVPRRIFGPKRDEVTGEWRNLHIEELNGLYCRPINIQLIKWRRMRCAECGGEERCVQDLGGETQGKQTTWKTLA
jgi:hypothetical protein